MRTDCVSIKNGYKVFTCKRYTTTYRYEFIYYYFYRTTEHALAASLHSTSYLFTSFIVDLEAAQRNSTQSIDDCINVENL